MVLARRTLSQPQYVQTVNSEAGDADVIGTEMRWRPDWRTRTAAIVAVASLGAGFAIGALSQSQPAGPMVGPAPAVSLSCHGPLPGRRLNANLSWGQPAEAVTLGTGDGRLIELDPAVSDNQRLSNAISHRYSAAGRYDVTLTARSGAAQAEATCSFLAADQVPPVAECGYPHSEASTTPSTSGAGVAQSLRPDSPFGPASPAQDASTVTRRPTAATCAPLMEEQ